MLLSKSFTLLVLLVFTIKVFPAPALAGVDLLSGQTVEIKSGEKGLILAFLSAKCPCSNSHVPELIKLAKAHPEFQFVGVHSNLDEPADSAKAYFEGVNIPFHVIQDDGAKIADQYKALKTPHVFVVSNSGETVFQGGMSDSKDCEKSDKKFLRDALDDLSGGRKVRLANARTLGCTISRRISAH